MPVLKSTVGIYGPWLDIKTNPPNGTEGHVWLVINRAVQPVDEDRVLLMSALFLKTILHANSIYTHWKPANLVVPDLPGVTPAATTLSIDAALAAWRDQNPDYAPDEGPSDGFIERFRAANKGLTNHTGPR